MTNSDTLLAGVFSPLTSGQQSLPSLSKIKIGLLLLDDMISSATQHILTDSLLREEESILADCINMWTTAQEKLEVQLSNKSFIDVKAGWYLHQRSQSGFELGD